MGDVLGAQPGLIPAGAGQTIRRSPGSSAPGAHPRRCGADNVSLPGPTVKWGSSPQVRGRRFASGSWWSPVGLIPAGAGQTDSASMSAAAMRAHPRRCGADGWVVAEGDVGEGSSPQVRGRPKIADFTKQGYGLIPAGAGQTSGSPTRRRTRRAHPRRCGADVGPVGCGVVPVGSSPQVRGRRARVVFDGVGEGLIPAGAGQTSGWCLEGLASTAHPRRCGADQNDGDMIVLYPGSSPQVRGRHEHHIRPVAPLGLIPAGAGQTLFMVGSFAVIGAHPRRCGADRGV